MSAPADCDSIPSVTPPGWAERQLPHLDTLLLEQAHLEKKAAAPPKMVIFAHHKDVMDSIANQVLHRPPRVPARGAAARRTPL